MQATTYSPASRLSDRQIVWAVFRGGVPVQAADGRPLVQAAWRIAGINRIAETGR
jgi:hypothetical protein